MPVGESSAAETPYVVVHRVNCDAQSDFNHQQHEPRLDYLDAPCMLANANQTSILEGTQPLDNIDWYLEDKPSRHFAVINHYDCVQYHTEIADKFERLSLPSNLDSRVLAQVRPYLYVLKEDAKEADRIKQTLLLSPKLYRAMDTLQASYPTDMSHWEAEKNLTYPYPQLWHSKDLLDNAAEKLTPGDWPQVIALRDFLEETVSDEWGEAKDMFEDGFVNNQHWTKLFRPNEPIVTLLENEPRAFICKEISRISEDKLHLQCWSWEFDGHFFRQNFAISVDWPNQSDLIPITDLSHYPLKFDTSDLTSRLRNRGATFWLCRQRNYISYNPSSQDTIGKSAPLRYMVDMSTYKLMLPPDSESSPSARLHESTMLRDEIPDAPHHPHFSLLMPPKIKGFGFHNKKWIDLLVERIEPIHWNKNVFTNDLVLQDGKKELIQALVTVHLEGTVKRKADFMTGKGEGLLILLHGGPGTGKTLTAESVAELAARPLYRVTCGDIGTDPEEVEKYLNSVLFIGTTWNCVVLLDEADVFLEERTKLDLQRNALVSVFLRVLEYYDGILILTSNRIGTFDEAFKSRVQLSLHYPPLNRENRLRVWENFVALLEDGSDKSKFSEIRQRLNSLASHKLNGRQIRNTMNTARQLAQFRDQPFGYKHLNQAIQNVLEFEKYVTTLHDDQTDEEYAEMHGIRHSNKKRKLENDLD